ncbi:hypothetical protein [Vitiosangium sp. GDMCC 1.1324]|uniref:hypothetical protein n=1 Tax=Vitiosangium sp. (strain GDMCC 1.1324) TaxID=2138576 RepID=UPI000D3D8B6A|nr:hypothetical protein [Vitiosangium sp. GDMCC 1.1324]PTL75157.1 hypothetical protein DAT35_56185 [Vitiosangium sp. GDMCC 1.1324]
MAWTSVTDSQGTTYRLYTQEKMNSCGCAAVMMIIKQMRTPSAAQREAVLSPLPASSGNT